jgi:hypothetical protein
MFFSAQIIFSGRELFSLDFHGRQFIHNENIIEQDFLWPGG